MIVPVTTASRAAFKDVLARLPFLELELQGTPWLDRTRAMELAGDCFAWFYSDRQQVELGDHVPLAGAAAAALLAQPALLSARALTRGDKMVSTAALRELWAALNRLFPLLGTMQGSDGESSGTGSGDAFGGESEDAVGQAGAEVAQKVMDTSETLKDAAMVIPATGWDLSKGKMVRIRLEDIRNVAELVQQKAWLKALIAVLGRIEELGAVWNPLPATMSKGEIHSVGRGGDVENMLPSEAMLLLGPATRTLFFARLYERSLLAYTMKATAREGGDNPGGPMIALVDTSGSMKGQTEIVAKGFVLAAARLARLQNRRFLLGIFGSKDEYKEFELVGKNTNPGEFLRFLAWSFHGGTDINGPINRVCAKIVQEGWEAADCLVITDGMALPSAHTKAVVDAVRKQFNTFFMGVIVGKARARGLDGLLDFSVFTDGDDIEGLGEAVRALKKRFRSQAL